MFFLPTETLVQRLSGANCCTGRQQPKIWISWRCEHHWQWQQRHNGNCWIANQNLDTKLQGESHWAILWWKRQNGTNPPRLQGISHRHNRSFCVQIQTGRVGQCGATRCLRCVLVEVNNQHNKYGRFIGDLFTFTFQQKISQNS